MIIVQAELDELVEGRNPLAQARIRRAVVAYNVTGDDGELAQSLYEAGLCGHVHPARGVCAMSAHHVTNHYYAAR